MCKKLKIMDPIISQPQEQLPVQPQKHFLNKKFIVTFVVLLLLGSGAYAGIWWWSNQTSQVAVPSVTPDPTVGWKTYTNTQYGFEFKYPDSIEVKELERHGRYYNGYDFGGPYLLLDLSSDKLGGSIEVNPAPRGFGYDWVPVSDKNIQIKNNEVISISIARDNSTDPSNYAVIKFSNHPNFFGFFEYKNNESEPSLIYQILSTFKFTK